MSRSQLEASIRLGEQWGRTLRGITARLGTKQYPDGQMVRAYRNARRAMGRVLEESSQPLQRILGATDVMTGLRQSVESIAMEALNAGERLGRTMAQGNAGIYRLPYSEGENLPSINATVSASRDIVVAHVERQDAYTRALILSESEDEEILGRDDSPGIFNPSGVVRDTDHWAADIASQTFGLLLFWMLGQMGPAAPRFEKVAIAIRDLRTTETCQNVDGQSVPVDQPFDLNGWSPAYADQMMWPPFHPFCRTGVAIALTEDIELLAGLLELENA